MSTHLGGSFTYVSNPHIRWKNQVKKVPLFFLDLKSKPNIHKFLWSPFWYLNWFFWYQYLTNVFKISISKFIPLVNLEMEMEKKKNLHHLNVFLKILVYLALNIH
jgi:hypothetical protein